MSADYNSAVVAGIDSKLDGTLDEDPVKGVLDATIGGLDGELEGVGADPCEPPDSCGPLPFAVVVVADEATLVRVVPPFFFSRPSLPLRLQLRR